MEAAIGLGSMGRPSDPVLLATVENALHSAVRRDRDKAVVIWSQVSLMALADKVPVAMLDSLAKGITNADPRLRVHTIHALGAMGSRAKAHVPELVAALGDKEKDVVAAACVALGQMGDPGPRAVAALTDLSASKETDEALAALPRPPLNGSRNRRNERGEGTTKITKDTKNSGRK